MGMLANNLIVNTIKESGKKQADVLEKILEHQRAQTRLLEAIAQHPQGITAEYAKKLVGKAATT